jgi:hypothetical protein
MKQAPRPMTLPGILPMPAPLVDEPIPEPPSRVPKHGFPIAAVVGGIAAALVVLVIVFLFFAKSAPPIVGQPRLDAQGHDLLHLTCDNCPDGTTAAIDGMTGTFQNHEADVPLTKVLSVGENPLAITIDRPGVGRDETIKITVPVAFRIRPDLAELAHPAPDKPPSLTIRVTTLPDATVVVDDKRVALDASGQGEMVLALGSDTLGASDEVKTIARKVKYTVTRAGSEPDTGEIALRLGVVPVHLDAPGAHAVIDASHFLVAGQTTPGATVLINGNTTKVEANGAFAANVDAPNVGELPVTVSSYLANSAPRAATLTVRRVANLEAEAKAASQGVSLGYDVIAANIAGNAGQVVYIEGEVAEARVVGHQTILVVDDHRGCAHGPCLMRVIHGAEDAIARGQFVRAVGRVTGPKTTAAGKTVPEIEADFVVGRKP